MKNSQSRSVLEVDSLAGLRDELRLQAHLFKAEAADRWKEAEARWQEIEQEIRAIRAAANQSRGELSAAAALTAEALRKTYRDLRSAMGSH